MSSSSSATSSTTSSIPKKILDLEKGCPFKFDYLPGEDFCGRCGSEKCRDFFQALGWVDVDENLSNDSTISPSALKIDSKYPYFLLTERCLHVVKTYEKDLEYVSFRFCSKPALAGLGICRTCMKLKGEQYRIRQEIPSKDTCQFTLKQGLKCKTNACRRTSFCLEHLKQKSIRSWLVLESRQRKQKEDARILVRDFKDNFKEHKVESTHKQIQTTSCCVILERGKNKGKYCSNKATKIIKDRSYCTTHYKMYIRKDIEELTEGKPQKYQKSQKSQKSQKIKRCRNQMYTFMESSEIVSPPLIEINNETTNEMLYQFVPIASQEEIDIEEKELRSLLLNGLANEWSLDRRILPDRCSHITTLGIRAGQRCSRPRALGVKFCKSCMRKKSVNGKISTLHRSILKV